MCKTVIQTEEQYEWAMGRIEELLPLVDDSTPTSAPEYIELELLSNMVADYSDEHYALDAPTKEEVLAMSKEDLGLTDEGYAMLLEDIEEEERRKRPAPVYPVGMGVTDRRYQPAL